MLFCERIENINTSINASFRKTKENWTVPNKTKKVDKERYLSSYTIPIIIPKR